MSHSDNKSKLLMILSMLTFGTIGLFVNQINLPSSFTAFSRAMIGSVFIGIFMLVTRRKVDKKAVIKNLKLLIPSGIAMGFNWICLFESYRYAGIPVGTLCYYMAPVILVFVSPFILKEKLTTVKVISAIVAIGGEVLISGVLSGSVRNGKGIALGLAAAVLYVAVIMINKFVTGISPVETTLVQLMSAALVMIPYVLLAEDVGSFVFDRNSVIFTIIVGVIHTGIVYMVYFFSVQKISAQTTAVFSYIDPVTAIILSALILNDSLSRWQIIGTVMILGATLFNELAPTLLNRKK